MTYAVAVGEMFDGIGFYGPFIEFDDAEKWADVHASANWWVVELLDTDIDGKGVSTLVIPKVDMKMLQQQYERLQEVVAFVEDLRLHALKVGTAVPDASILDGIVEMLGDQLELPGVLPCTDFQQTDSDIMRCRNCGGHFAIHQTFPTATNDDPGDACRTEECDGKTDDGEGYDGYCGNCADRAANLCEFHPWNEDENGPAPAECPECKSIAENHADTEG